MSSSLQNVPDTPLALARTPRWGRYVAIGDSLTEGLGDPLPGGALRGWATLLAEYLRRDLPELEFVNLAVRGHRAGDALRRQLPAAVALRPDLVSVIIGANDILLSPWPSRRRFAGQLDRLITPFVDDGATVVLSTIPDPAGLTPLPRPLREALRRRIESTNDITRAAARRHSTTLLDTWADPRIRRPNMFSFDRVHPSADGHRLIAASVAELLGVTVPPEGHARAPVSPGAIMRRHATEAAWLLRHGLASPAAMA